MHPILETSCAPSVVRRLLPILILALLAPAAGVRANDLEEAFSRQRTQLQNANNLLVVNMLGDIVPEIIATDVQGRIQMFDATTGNMILRTVEAGESGITSPVVADFTGDTTLDIGVGTDDGRVVIFDGGTLVQIAEVRATDSQFVVAPTVATIPDPEVPGGTRESIILIDQRGGIHSYYLNQAGVLTATWAPVATGSRASSPMSVGYPRRSDVKEIVMPGSDGRILFVEAATGSTLSLVAHESRSVATSVLLADFSGNGIDELTFTMDNGDIYIRRYDAGRNRLAEVHTFPTGSSPVMDPVLVVPHGAMPAEGLIFQALRGTLVAARPTGGPMIRGEERAFGSINTALSVIPGDSTRRPLIAFGIGQVVAVVPTDEWFAGTPQLRYPAATIGEPLTNMMPVVGVRDADGGTGSYKYLLVGITTSGRLVGIQTGRTFSVSPTAGPEASSQLAPWMTRGATPRRNNLIDNDYLAREGARAARLAAALSRVQDEWQAAADDGDWETALARAKWLYDYDPFNAEYKRQHQRTFMRRYLLQILAGALAVVAIVALIGWLVARVLITLMLERKARSTVQRGRFPEAEALYERLILRKPRDARVVGTLAMVYLSTRNYSAKTIDVYARAHAADPQNADLLQAHAEALMEANRTDAASLPVYEAALKTAAEPHHLEYFIGMCHKNAGDMEEAGKRLRAALRGGRTSDDVYSALCDIYLETNNRGAKALPVYRQQFPARQSDQRFLEAYLDSCIDAKQADGNVESLCHQVLENNPAYAPAYCHLAMLYLQKNEVGRAIEEVTTALQHAPGDGRAATLLAQCYLVEGRTDDAAVDAFKRALAVTPDDPDLLRTMAEINLRAKVFNREAVELFHRSRAANPKDTATLRGLAEVARLTTDHALAIDCIETLQMLGFSDAETTRQLAQAYVASGVIEPKTEKTLREALRHSPGDEELLAALARVLSQLDNESTDAIAVYEARLRSAPEDRDVGTILTRSYIKSNRFEDALRTSQQLLAQFPNDPELQRLVALASLYDNKIDEAVKEYTAILSRNPDDHEAQYHLAMAFAQKGRMDDEAATVYTRALATRPTSLELNLAMARVHLSRNESAKSVEIYQSMLKKNPGSEDVLSRQIARALQEFPDAMRVRWFLCELLIAFGRLREAMEQLDTIYQTNPNHAENVLTALGQVLNKDPNYIPALSTRARILSAQGNHLSARENLEKAYKLQPSNPEILRDLTQVYEAQIAHKDDPETRFRLGKLYYMVQDFDKAIGAFQRTSQDYRLEADSAKMLGKCFTNKGMLDLALQEFKKLVVDEETKELLYDLAQRYEGKKDLVGAKTVYRQLFAADIEYKDVKSRFEMLSGSTSDPMAFERTSIVQEMSEDAKRRYELLDEIGRGAMGIVYRAKDRELDEIVALKILPDAMSNNPEAVRRFKVEARNARKLSHPNIVRIHDIGEEMGRKYISMEFVDGADLKKKVKSQGPLSLPEFFHYSLQVADALAYAHRLGIVHRDIKPANVMLNSADQVKITDFGIAKMLDSTAVEGTMAGAVMGTPLYMSPEQVQGLPVDNRADIYAYGIMLYELLSGKPPFTQGDLAYQHIHSEPQPIEGCPPEVWEIVAKCLAKKRDDRWVDGDAIMGALKAAKVMLGV